MASRCNARQPEPTAPMRAIASKPALRTHDHQPFSQAAHFDVGSLSWSIVPALHRSVPHVPTELAAAYVPFVHVTHGVAGFLSSSVVPAWKHVQ
jgi:hypothetical protein